MNITDEKSCIHVTSSKSSKSYCDEDAQLTEHSWWQICKRWKWCHCFLIVTATRSIVSTGTSIGTNDGSMLELTVGGNDSIRYHLLTACLLHHYHQTRTKMLAWTNSEGIIEMIMLVTMLIVTVTTIVIIIRYYDEIVFTIMIIWKLEPRPYGWDSRH